MEKPRKMAQKIPDDNIFDILSRLPKKSLYRFRCVCKSWRSWIFNKKLIILSDDQHYSTIDCYDLASNSVDNAALMPTPPVIAGLMLLASCDNWLLLGNKGSDKFWLWNPSTGEYKEFPDQPHTGGNFPTAVLFGISHDPSLDDYTMVSVVCQGTPSRKNYCTFFSLKTSSWKKGKQQVPSLLAKDDYRSKVPVSVHGSPHWVVSDSGSANRYILRFDLEMERLSYLLQPRAFRFRHPFNLSVMRGNLCAYSGHLASKIEIWEMKEYRVEESWMQVCLISKSSLLSQKWNHSQLKPLAYTKKGEVVAVINGKELVICNVKDNTVSKLKTFEQQMEMRVATYVDKLSFF